MDLLGDKDVVPSEFAYPPLCVAEVDLAANLFRLMYTKWSPISSAEVFGGELGEHLWKKYDDEFGRNQWVFWNFLNGPQRSMLIAWYNDRSEKEN